MSQIFLEHAIKYNDQNLSIFPCGKENGKKPIIRSWAPFQEECVDHHLYDIWIKKFPNANIGLVTGFLNQLTVVDCDDPKRSLEDLEKEYGETTIIVKTPRGGHHLYYKFNGERSENKFDQNIDIKAQGGYVIAPYSKNPISGKKYEFLKGTLQDIHSLRKSAHPLTKEKQINSTLLSEKSTFGKAGQILKGNRNDHLFKKTKDFAINANSKAEISNFAKEYNQKNLSPPLNNLEENQVVNSVWKYKTTDRLWAKGEQQISIPKNKYFMLCKNPTSLSLYLLLVSHHKNQRNNFRIIQDSVGKILGCDRRTVARAIDCLITLNIIRKTYSGKGKGDGHQYCFC